MRYKEIILRVSKGEKVRIATMTGFVLTKRLLKWP